MAGQMHKPHRKHVQRLNNHGMPYKRTQLISITVTHGDSDGRAIRSGGFWVKRLPLWYKPNML